MEDSAAASAFADRPAARSALERSVARCARNSADNSFSQRTPGSVRGAVSNGRPYRDHLLGEGLRHWAGSLPGSPAQTAGPADEIWDLGATENLEVLNIDRVSVFRLARFARGQIGVVLVGKVRPGWLGV